MTEVADTHLYDHPQYYDVVFGADWREEYDFLRACFDRHAKRPVRRLFEPACGTGRLLVKFAAAGYEVAGNDLSAKAVAYCNARLVRRGFAPTAVVGDMADFALRRQVDAAFNPINSFRHLPTERTAESHLRCVARALAKGGIYVLGLHLTPKRGQKCVTETWRARRGPLAVTARIWSTDVDLRSRREGVGMTFDIRTPTRQFRLRDQMSFRIYTAEQIRRLLSRVGELELVETYDFTYDIEEPSPIGPTTEDVILVLRKR